MQTPDSTSDSCGLEAESAIVNNLPLPSVDPAPRGFPTGFLASIPSFPDGSLDLREWTSPLGSFAPATKAAPIFKAFQDSEPRSKQAQSLGPLSGRSRRT